MTEEYRLGCCADTPRSRARVEVGAETEIGTEVEIAAGTAIGTETAHLRIDLRATVSSGHPGCPWGQFQGQSQGQFEVHGERRAELGRRRHVSVKAAARL